MLELLSDAHMLRVICNNPLFCGLNRSELERALSFFSSETKSYAAGTFLRNAGDPMPFFGLVLQGVIQVYMDDINGSQIIMATVTEGGTFGESLSFLNIQEIPVYIVAETDTSVLWLRADTIRSGAAAGDSGDFVCRFISMLAERALSLNNRIQILSKKSLRGKLNTFFTEYAQKNNSNVFSVPFNRDRMATYLGTDRSALSRELSNMKKDGLIDYYHNSFRILISESQ